MLDEAFQFIKETQKQYLESKEQTYASDFEKLNLEKDIVSTEQRIQHQIFNNEMIKKERAAKKSNKELICRNEITFQKVNFYQEHKKEKEVAFEENSDKDDEEDLERQKSGESNAEQVINLEQV